MTTSFARGLWFGCVIGLAINGAMIVAAPRERAAAYAAMALTDLVLARLLHARAWPPGERR